MEPRAIWVEQRLANEQSETARHGQQTVLETETTYGQAGWTWREMATKTEESDGDARRRPNKRLDKAKKNDDGDKDSDDDGRQQRDRMNEETDDKWHWTMETWVATEGDEAIAMATTKEKKQESEGKRMRKKKACEKQKQRKR